MAKRAGAPGSPTGTARQVIPIVVSEQALVAAASGAAS
jgi:hydroxymethylglutaryl-CoA reductase